MLTLPVSEIIIGTRHRRDMGNLAQLAESISQQGLLQPIGVTEDNELVFGERRLRACSNILGWTHIPVRVVNVTSIVEGEYAENEVREDFTLSERVAIGQAVEQQLAGRQGQRTDLLQVNLPEVTKGETRDIAAERAGFGSGKTYDYAKQVVNSGAPELVQAVERGEVAVSTAATLTELPQEEQVELVARGEKEILAAAKAIRAERNVVRFGDRLQKIAESVNEPTPLTELGSRFPVIYADPPWQYEHSMDDGDCIENHYPTMTLDDIRAMPLDDIATADCILFLWTTSPKLEEAMTVLAAWRFNYRTCGIWDKEWIGPGYYFRQRHELLLVATRGNLPVPLPENRPASVYSERRTEHSRKPKAYHEMIERMYPDLPKLELFAREAREGWTVWGNQV